MPETINQRVAHCRKLANLTQTETAEKLGMKCSTYSQMERKGNISGQRLVELAKIFGVSSELLLHGESKTKDILSEENQIIKNRDVNVFKNPTDLKPILQDVPFIVTKKEENIIMILRNLPKKDKEDIISIIEEKYKKAKSKSAD